MLQWAEIRRRVLVDGVSKRQILRESQPPGFRLREPRPKPKLGPYLDRIAQILEEDKQAPRKQRHTAKRIYQRLREAGYQGGYSVVRDAVRRARRLRREVFVPLAHPPGEAQVDFGEAVATVAGRL